LCCQLTLSKAAQGGRLEEISGVDGQHRDPIGVLEALISKKYIMEIVSLRTGEEDLRNMASYHSVHAFQLPLIPAYSLTDYRSQGQTISHTIIDIGTPPTGGLTPFNVYVALSRSRGQDNFETLMRSC
jgi:hypothetical protein